MGNLLSCKMSTASGHLLIKSCYSRQITAARVMFPTGEIRVLEEPTKVAELMMVAPNFMVVNADTLKKIGARLSPLAADHDLETCNLYVMLPMQRKHSLVTAADLSSLFLKRRGRVRDLPLAEAAHDHKEAGSGSYPRRLQSLLDDETTHRLSMSRSRKPLLDTIVEELAHRRSIC